jgi:hypothetical protein
MTAAFFENETFVRAATRRIPLGRLLEADEIAGAAAQEVTPGLGLRGRGPAVAPGRADPAK